VGPTEKISSTTTGGIVPSYKISVDSNEKRAVLTYVNDSDDLLFRVGAIK